MEIEEGIVISYMFGKHLTPTQRNRFINKVVKAFSVCFWVAGCRAPRVSGYTGSVTLKEDARKKVEDLASKLGESHEDTLKARGDYGNVLMEHGERAAASDEFQAVVAAKTKSLGQRHISTLETRHNYALLLGYEMGEIQEAINTMAEVVEGWEEVLGESHRTTKAAARALADWQASGAELQRGAHQSSE